jgi:MFS family permease
VSRGSSSNPFRPLAHRNFRLFWGGQTLSLIGTWMQTVAEGWLALELSNSAFMVGVAAAASSFPILVLSLYGGVVADRHDKLKVVKIAQTLLLVQATTFWYLTITHRLTIEVLITLALVNGIISAFEIPARQSFIVELVGREDLVDAIALNSAGFNIARIIGPSIAALVIAAFGLAWCFGFNSLSYLAVLAGLFMIRVPAWERNANAGSSLEGLREGFQYIRDTPLVGVLIRVVAVNAVFGLPFLAMMPVEARNVLHTGATGYGLLLTAVGFGALCGALSLAWLGQRVSRGRLFMRSAYAFALLLLVFALMRERWAATGVLVLVGYFLLLYGSLANGTLQSIVPDELRGRVMAVYVFVAVGFVPIGSFIAGAVAKAVGVQWAIGAGAAVMLGYTYWAYWKYPALKTV